MEQQYLPSWRDQLESFQSLGSQTAKAASLADLHRARERHMGQFFTPLAVAKVMWALAQQAADSADGRHLSLLDNSIGTGRLMHFATPDRFTLGGFDVHAEVIYAVQSAAEVAGFHTQLHTCSMADARPCGFDIALCNPPFSIHLESPNLEPLACCSYGKFGPATSAQSDEYALCQALQAAQVAIVLVPASLADAVTRGEVVGHEGVRLRAVFRLGGHAFKEEGVNVETCILVFGPDAGTYQGEFKVSDPDTFTPPALGLDLGNNGKPRIRVIGLDDSEPVVTLPVTGLKQVRMTHKGRRIGLQFECGFTQARVLNAIYRDRVYSTDLHKLPRGVRYAGQGVLDIPTLLVTEDPWATFSGLLATIRGAGGEPVVCPSLQGYLSNQIRLKPRALAPLGHWVFSKSQSDAVQSVALKSVPLDPTSWSSPLIKRGESATLERVGPLWRVSKDGLARELADEEAKRLFDMPASKAGWVQIHKPLQEQFPAMAHQLEKLARSMGLDKHLWEFQFADLIEICMKPSGAVVAWQQGLGKARLCAAIIRLRRIKHGLVVMPAYLVDEFAKRLQAADVPQSLWKVIAGKEDIQTLAQINVISYERLRREVETGSKATYAKRLRNRFGLVILDEGERISNSQSDQSRAANQLNAKVQYVSSGTPTANYARDMLPVASFAVGDSVLGNAFGVRHPFLSPVNAKSMAYSTSGVDEFRESHVTMEWCTNEFADSLQEGAKREVPRIKQLDGYRNWVGTFVKRRLHREPEVEACVHIPDPIAKTLTVDWDEGHLAYYLRVADEFAQWYQRQRPDERLSNLMLLLARIGAVEAAGNIPQRTPKTGAPWFGGMTSKQRAIVDLASRFTEAGEKTVIFAESPRLLEVLERSLTSRGVDCTMFHGEIAKPVRNRGLDRQWRYGPSSVLLASYGTMQAGFDLYQGSKVILANRSWSHKEEDQAIRRLLRPQQTRNVEAWRIHLAGSLDEYQDQMVSWKASSAESGLDWGEPQQDDVPFLHLDTILGRFVESLASLHGMKPWTFREQLKKAA